MMQTIGCGTAASTWVKTGLALQAEDKQDEQEPKQDEPSFASLCDPRI